MLPMSYSVPSISKVNSKLCNIWNAHKRSIQRIKALRYKLANALDKRCNCSQTDLNFWNIILPTWTTSSLTEDALWPVFILSIDRVGSPGFFKLSSETGQLWVATAGPQNTSLSLISYPPSSLPLNEKPVAIFLINSFCCVGGFQQSHQFLPKWLQWRFFCGQAISRLKNLPNRL